MANPFLDNDTSNSAHEQKSSNPFLEGENSEPQVAPSNYSKLAGAPITMDKNPITGDPNMSIDAANATWADKLNIFNRQFGRNAESVLSLISPVGQEAIQAQHDYKEEEYKKAYQRTPSPIIDFAGKTASIVPGIAAMVAGGAPTTLAGIVGQSAATGFGAGLLDWSHTGSISMKERIDNGISNGLISGAIPVAGKGFSSALHTIIPNLGVSSAVTKILSPKTAAIEDIANDIKVDAGNSSEAALNKLAAEQSKGIRGRTPGEVMGGPVTRAKEAALNATDAEKGTVSEVYNTSQNSAKQQIYDTVDKMAPANIEDKVTSAFDKMKTEFVAPDNSITSVSIKGTNALGQAEGSANYIPDVIKNNPTLLKIYQNDIKGSDSKAIRNLPDNSVAQLEELKKIVSNPLYSPNVNSKTASHIKDWKPSNQALVEAKKELTDVLKNSNSYNEAMSFSKQKIIKQEYLDQMGTKLPKAGAKGDYSIDDIFGMQFKNQNFADKFVKDVEVTGGDPKAASELLDLADSLRDSPLLKVLKAKPADAGQTYISNNKIGYIQSLVNHFTMNRYRKALLEVTLSGDKWASDVKAVLQGASPQEKQIKLLELLKSASEVKTKKDVTEVGKAAFKYGAQHPKTVRGAKYGIGSAIGDEWNQLGSLK